MSPRQNLITLGAFAILAIGLLTILHDDLQPFQLYDLQKVRDGFAIPEFIRGETLAMEFVAPGSISCVDLRDAIFQPGQELRVNLCPASQPPEVAGGRTLRLGEGKNPSRFCVKTPNAPGEKMRLELQWLRDPGPAKVAEFRFLAGETPVTAPIPGGALEFQPSEKESIFEMEFAAPEAQLTAIDLTGLLTATSTRLRMELVNLDTNATLLRDNLTRQDGVRKLRTSKNEKGDRLQLRLTWRTIRPPKLRVAEGNLNYPLQVTANGRPCPYRPFVMLQYTWWTRVLNLLWIPALILAGFAFRNSKLIPSTLIGLGLSATVSSVLAWQQFYSTYSATFDPDHFARVGGLMADWARGLDTGQFAKFTEHWRYEWLPFMSLCLAGLNLLGLKLSFGYLLLSALPGFGALLVFHAILRQSFKLEPRWALLGVLLYACHHFMLKSFAKPSTDPMGLLLILSALYLILRRLEHKEGWSDFVIAGLLLVHLFTRPTGTLFAPFACGMAVWADGRREGRFDLKAILGTALRMALGPAVLFLAAFILLNWGENLKLASETYSRAFATPKLFVIRVLSCVQWLPLLWIAAWPRLRKDPMIWFLGCWVIYYFIILIVIRPAYVTRVFLPVHFVAIVPAVLGFRELWARRPAWRWSLVGGVAVFIAVNLGVVVYQTGSLYPPPGTFAEWL